MTSITASSNKADIIDASLEIIDTQAEKLQILEQKLNVALWMSAVAAAWAFLF